MASTSIRVYSSQPAIEEILKIEGVIIVDQTPPGSPDVIGNNTVCLVGEFTDMRLAVRVDPATGAVTTSCQPDFAYSPADFANKFGGPDWTIGRFGAEMGNGWVAAARKPWPAGSFICAPINLCSAYGTRYWRQLPTNRSATDPTPIVPLSVGVIEAGREFRAGSNRVRVGTRVVFTADPPISSGTDGVVTPASLPAATQAFVAASGDFNGTTDPTRRAQKGDLIVLGSYNAASGANLTCANTYRITSVNVNGTTLTLQRLDGSNFTTSNWEAGTSMPWRLHPAQTGDSGGHYTLAENQGYVVPARPLDATISAATLLGPVLTPPASTGVVWDVLSGLTGSTHAAQPLTYPAAVQAPNAPNSSALDALYQGAIDSLGGDAFPRSQIYAIAAARKSATIHQALRVHCLSSTRNGHPRICYISPAVNVTNASTVFGDSSPGVGANRSEKVLYRWSAVRTFVAEAVGIPVVGSDGQTYTDGYLDTPLDEWCLCLRALLAPERDPGQSSPPVPLAFGNITDYARGVTPPTEGEYVVAKQRGVGVIKIDTPPPQIQSSVTSSLTSGERDENRRVMADFVEINLANLMRPYIKEPLTDDLKETETGQCEAFLQLLKDASRIEDFQVDPFSLNTPQMLEQGIFVMKVSVRMIAIQKAIVLSVSVGPNVTIQPLNQ